MIFADVIKVLQGKCKQGEGHVEVEADLLQSCIAGLQEAEDLRGQLALAQEQLTLKPSVAKKLNEKIRALEAELQETRQVSKVADLEKKVQRLEVELKQSYATKNFTLKNGLLDIEKRYRDLIVTDTGVQELWGDVMVLLNEGEVSHAVPAVIAKRAFKGEPSEVETVEQPDSDVSPASLIQQYVEKYKDTQYFPPNQAVPEAHFNIKRPVVEGIADVKSTFSVPSKPLHEEGSVHAIKAAFKECDQVPSGASDTIGMLRPTGFGDKPHLANHQYQTQTNAVFASLKMLQSLFNSYGQHPTFGTHASGTQPADKEHKVADVLELQKEFDTLQSSVSELAAFFFSLCPKLPDSAPNGGETIADTLDSLNMDNRSNFVLKEQAEALSRTVAELQLAFSKEQNAIHSQDSTEGTPADQNVHVDASYYQHQLDSAFLSLQSLKAAYDWSQYSDTPLTADQAGQLAAPWKALLPAKKPSARVNDDTAAGSEGAAAGIQTVAPASEVAEAIDSQSMVDCFSSFLKELEHHGIYHPNTEDGIASNKMLAPCLPEMVQLFSSYLEHGSTAAAGTFNSFSIPVPSAALLALRSEQEGRPGLDSVEGGDPAAESEDVQGSERQGSEHAASSGTDQLSPQAEAAGPALVTSDGAGEPAASDIDEQQEEAEKENKEEEEEEEEGGNDQPSPSRVQEQPGAETGERESSTPAAKEELEAEQDSSSAAETRDLQQPADDSKPVAAVAVALAVGAAAAGTATAVALAAPDSSQPAETTTSTWVSFESPRARSASPAPGRSRAAPPGSQSEGGAALTRTPSRPAPPPPTGAAAASASALARLQLKSSMMQIKERHQAALASNTAAAALWNDVVRMLANNSPITPPATPAHASTDNLHELASAESPAHAPSTLASSSTTPPAWVPFTSDPPSSAPIIKRYNSYSSEITPMGDATDLKLPPPRLSPTNPFADATKLPAMPVNSLSSNNPFAEGLLTDVPDVRRFTEVEVLRAECAELTSSLASYKQLVQRMNLQYKQAMEKADEEGFALERTKSEAQKISTTAETLRDENNRVIKELVDAKISLAETKGDYLQLLRGLQRALAKETDYRAKLDELEELAARQSGQKEETPAELSSRQSLPRTVAPVPSARLSSRTSTSRALASNEIDELAMQPGFVPTEI